MEKSGVINVEGFLFLERLLARVYVGSFLLFALSLTETQDFDEELNDQALDVLRCDDGVGQESAVLVHLEIGSIRSEDKVYLVVEYYYQRPQPR